MTIQSKTGTGDSLSGQCSSHSSIGPLVRQPSLSVICVELLALSLSLSLSLTLIVLGVIALTLIINIFRVRKIGFKSVFVMVG